MMGYRKDSVLPFQFGARYSSPSLLLHKAFIFVFRWIFSPTSAGCEASSQSCVTWTSRASRWAAERTRQLTWRVGFNLTYCRSASAASTWSVLHVIALFKKEPLQKKARVQIGLSLSGSPQGLQTTLLHSECCEFPFPARTEGGRAALHHHRFAGKT